ncbi:hypothetical protein J7D59_002071 [Escherichia coli]|nr:hypothetical protein [Escherichia coli]
MFPKYSEIVKVVFSQIIANHFFDKLDTATELKVHSELLYVLNTLVPDQVDSVSVTLLSSSAHVIVVFGLDAELVIQCEVDFDSQEIKCFAI